MKKFTFLILLMTLFFSWNGAAQINTDTEIPQGISPNGDGLNDTFDLSDFDVKRIEIYNRLGTLVYSKDNYINEWNGQTNNGDELPIGTYFYTMIYEGGDKQMSAWVYINK